jgi:hypothetical protein
MLRLDPQRSPFEAWGPAALFAFWRVMIPAVRGEHFVHGHQGPTAEVGSSGGGEVPSDDAREPTLEADIQEER